MDWVYISAVTVLLLPVQASAKNSYVITVPATFRPGMLVNMTVLILKEDLPGTPVDVNVTFLINSVATTSATGQFRAGKTGSLQLQIPSEGLPDKSTRYRSENHLRVTGSGGLTFNETALTGISFKDKGFSLYVQTDKSIYKPSQTVHMRILAVYPDLKVYTGKMTILITDPKNNKLSKWKDESTTSGVVTKDFELSSQPNMGNWKISIEIEERTEETTFEVKEYVLPKFKVDVLTNTYASAGNGDIQGSVSAKYTYGKGVKGKAKMSVYFPCHNRHVKISYAKDESQCKTDVTEFQIDGTHSFGIAKKKILSLYPYDGSPYHGNGWNKVVVNISVTDELTQKTHFGYTTVSLHGNSIVLKYSDSNPKYFKPNVAFQILIEVTRPDDSPITNRNIKVKVSTSTYPKSTGLTRTYTTDKDGYIVVQQTITQDVQQFIMKAEGVDEYGMKAILDERLSKFNSKSNTFLSLTAEDYEVQAGKEIVCNVSSTEAFSSLNYMIQSRGNTIVSSSVLKSPKGKSASLHFSATSLMSPSAKIVVYFVRDNGEIVADSLTIKVNGAFDNHVSVEFSAEVRKPGEAINVDVKASPYSLVGLLAVDKSVLLLKKSNDFSVEQVMEDLNSYDGGASFPSWWRWRRRKRSFFPWYTSAKDSYGVFKAVGVAVLTDCDDFKSEKRLFWLNERTEYDSKIMFKSSSNDGGQTQLSDVKKIRTFFPETWLWRNIETNSAGNAQVSTIVPDTITSWVLSGFAVSNVTGFGVAHDKPQLRVFQPFFLYMDLPYSVIRGEELAIKVIIFNYEDTEMKVTVTLKSSGDWNNLVAIDSNDVNSESSSNADVVRVIAVPANGGETVAFPIEPIKLGNIPITVTAQSTTSADAAKRNLLVQPEGIEQEYSYSLLIDLESTSIDFSKELELALPANVVQGSAKATMSVIGDIMGSSISGIEKLLKMPYGCGEQNMINFAPSMFIRAYLETVGQLTPSIKEKSVRFMISGYQRELSYQHHDGSYSAFGESDGVKRSGSLWLTAFVVKSFSRAQSYIYIDPEYLWKSIKFILSTQLRSGSFKESGHVSSYLQGGLKSSAPEALTAYVLVSLLESGNNNPEVKEGISKAVRFLKEKLNTIEDTYTLAIMAYAMELADDPEKERVLDKLLEKAIREDGTMHWTEENSQNEKNTWSRPYYKPRSADIEITSYALLVYVHKAEKRNGLPISRWLAQQRNSLGGYSSTQDTVIGLQALSEFAPLVFSPHVSLTVDVELSSDSGFKKSFQINKNNMIILQKEELRTVDGKVRISGSGKGICVVQIGVTYNVDKAPGDTSFKLNVKVISADKKAVKAQSCVAYTGDEPKSGMVIMEFGLPSGFSIDQDDVSELLSDQNSKIKRVETSGRKAVLYFDEVLKTEELCVTLNSVRSYDVGKTQPIPVVVYDYYKPEKRATTMYSAEATENVAARLATSSLQSVAIAFLIMLFADFC